MSSKQGDKKGLVWLRRDLRCSDNPALAAAVTECEQVLAVYLLTEAQWDRHRVGFKPRWWLLENLKAVAEQLELRHIPLLICNASDYSQTPARLLEICRSEKITDLYFNVELEINERNRDSQVREQLAAESIRCHRHQDQTLLTPGTVLTGKDEYYRVYTPFKKAVQQQISPIVRSYQPLAAPTKLSSATASKDQENPLDLLTLAQLPDYSTTRLDDFSCFNSELWPAGEAIAQARLQLFLDQAIDGYKEQRDFPGQDDTSRLSPYLAVGAISLRQCFYAALERNAFSMQSDNAGINTWINELIWREFYKHLLIGFPDLCKYQNFNRPYDAIPWRDAPQEFQAWCDGNTGYPLVDAAMRQLKTEGWMHNRLRMVVAMFLTKHLLIDWRKGETFFAKHLLDLDLAANNGGWQWSASTGADGAPYFRIFNPSRQAERFDPEGDFTRHYLPELAELDKRQIHQPPANSAKANHYPEPMVDHSFAVDRAKQTFKSALQ